MKHIFVNFKRFDIPVELGGVNRLTSPHQWGEYIVKNTQDSINKYANEEVEFVMFMPEAHIISAVSVLDNGSKLKIGCQSVFYKDTEVGGNFGAFTTGRTANSMKALGCTHTIIGHSEERKAMADFLNAAEVCDTKLINKWLNKKIRSAIHAGLTVLYCIGEKGDEKEHWKEVLNEQLTIGLDGVDKRKIIIAYEPIWAIGPGKTPPGKEYIQKIARYVKNVTNDSPVIYGGGLKSDNARMLASIPEIDGGLIALTRFQGEIGFYPEEFLEIVRNYLGK